MGAAIISNILDCIELLHKNNMLGYTVKNKSYYILLYNDVDSADIKKLPLII